MAELTEALMKRLDIIHKTTSSYHAQANGQVERMNHVIAAIISHYVDSKHKNWDEFIEALQFAINTAKQESTKVSPFKSIYGREPNLPIDIWLQADANPRLPAELADLAYGDRLMEELKSIRQLVKMRINIAQTKQKLRYDSKHREQDFQVGDLVYLV